MTEVKFVDFHEEIIKIEPILDNCRAEENDSLSRKLQTFKNESAYINILEFHGVEELANDEIKQEIIECEEPKIEHGSDLLIKFDHDSISENDQNFITNIKKELLEDTSDVLEIKESDVFIDVSFLKQEVSEYAFSETDGKLLSSHCDLPTLKDENCKNYFPIATNKQADRIKNITKVKGAKKKRYSCPVCEKNFPSKSRSKHINGHFGKRSVVCKFCGKFMNKIEFFHHYFIHVVKNRTQKVFKKIFDVFKIDNIELKSHTNLCPTELNQKCNFRHLVFKCTICSRYFKCKSSLHRHLIVHTFEKPFQCGICFKRFNRKDNLMKHLPIHYIEKPFMCDICSQRFNQKYNLQQHLKIHTNETPFKCNICLKQFKQNYYLKRHLIVHTNEQPFQCKLCCKKFNHKSSLRNHLLIHSNEKTFECHKCSKKFNNQFGLRAHLLIHANKKSFKCNICPKEFIKNGQLKQHFIIDHTNKKSFKCDICSKKFHVNSKLQQHLKMHSNNKPFKCDNCSKAFIANDRLQKHLKIHNEKPFKCDICLKKFTQKGHLKRHLSIHRS